MRQVNKDEQFKYCLTNQTHLASQGNEIKRQIWWSKDLGDLDPWSSKDKGQVDLIINHYTAILRIWNFVSCDAIFMTISSRRRVGLTDWQALTLLSDFSFPFNKLQKFKTQINCQVSHLQRRLSCDNVFYKCTINGDLFFNTAKFKYRCLPTDCHWRAALTCSTAATMSCFFMWLRCYAALYELFLLFINLYLACIMIVLATAGISMESWRIGNR